MRKWLFSKPLTKNLELSVSLLLALNPSPNKKKIDSSKLKECADDDFNFDEKGRKFSKMEENTVGNGEIARYKQFLLFH